MRLANKVALIIGAGSGIGRESALLFAQAGAQVAVCDLSVAGGEETVGLIQQASGQAVFVQVDVAKAADVQAAIASTEQAYERLNVLFNNAGIFHANDGSVLETDESGYINGATFTVDGGITAAYVTPE